MTILLSILMVVNYNMYKKKKQTNKQTKNKQ